MSAPTLRIGFRYATLEHDMDLKSANSPSQQAEADDLHLGSFSDNPPWSLANRELKWKRVVPILRREQRRQLPGLTKPPRIPPVGRAFTVILVLGRAIGMWYLRERRGSGSRAGLALRIRLAAERLGPTYIKLAQI